MRVSYSLGNAYRIRHEMLAVACGHQPSNVSIRCYPESTTGFTALSSYSLCLSPAPNECGSNLRPARNVWIFNTLSAPHCFDKWLIAEDVSLGNVLYKSDSSVD